MLTDEGFNATMKFCLILIVARVADLLTKHYWQFGCWEWIIGFFLMLYIVQFEIIRAKVKAMEELAKAVVGKPPVKGS